MVWRSHAERHLAASLVCVLNTDDSTRRVALYARQSKADPDGIDRQLPRLRKEAEERGWAIVGEYVDDGLSASKSRGPSSSWHRMLLDAEAGKIDTVLAVDLDSLLRTLQDLLVLIEHKLMARTIDGEIDITTADGEFRATILAAIARFEVRRKGERQSRAQAQRAAQGRAPKGQRPLGYAVNGDVVPEEAEAVRKIYQAFAVEDGPSIASIAKGLSGVSGPAVPKSLPRVPKFSRTVMIERNARRAAAGIDPEPVPDDGPWDSSTVLGILRNPRYAGYSTYTRKTLPSVKREDGSETGKRRSWRAQILRDDNGDPVRAQWDPIVDENVWWTVQQRLDQPSRITNRTGSTARQHLGSGLYLCGTCMKPVKSSSNRYTCAGHVTRTRSHVDDWVLRIVRARLARPDLRDAIPHQDEPRLLAIQAEIDTHRARIKRAWSDYRDDLIEAFEYKVVKNERRRPSAA
jgi:site-specific DNA recombinase